MNARAIQEGGTERTARSLLVTILLVCGILSSLVYVAADVLAAARWESYHYADRAVSELLAIGAPTRAFIVPPMTAYNLLILAFGVGVLMVAGRKRSLRVSGILLVVYGIVSWMGLVVFPLRPDSGLSASGAMPLSGQLHMAATAALVLLMFLFIGFGSGAAGKGFRLYSVVTIVVVLAGGLLAGSQVDRAAAGLLTPGLGLIERANVYGSLLWVAMLAIVLLRRHLGLAGESVGGVASVSPKKVTVLVGSPHRGGATFDAAQKFAAHLEAFGDVETEIVGLTDFDIRVCRGCKVCLDRDEEFCPLKDDRDVLIEKMATSDGVVFASPNYSFQVSGVMKILLDRLGFLFHRPRFHGKTSSAIIVQGIYGGQKIRKYLEFVGGGLGFNVVKGSVIRTLLPMTAEATRKMDEALADQALRFHKQLLLPPYRSPSLFALMMFRMSRTAMQNSGREGTKDFAYYSERGWFESDYYYPTHLGPLKKAVGAFFDWGVRRMPAFRVERATDETPGTAKPAAQ